MLATMWWPHTDLIGLASILPLGIVVLVTMIVRFGGRRGMAFAAPVTFAILAVVSAAFPFTGRRFPNADDFVGYYIWSLAACCHAWEVARSGSRVALIYGCAIILPMGWLLVLEFLIRSCVLVEVPRPPSEVVMMLASMMAWCPLFAMLTYRAARRYSRASRIRRGLCGTCGYNMRESPERCPECGQPAATAGERQQRKQAQ